MDNLFSVLSRNDNLSGLSDRQVGRSFGQSRYRCHLHIFSPVVGHVTGVVVGWAGPLQGMKVNVAAAAAKTHTARLFTLLWRVFPSPRLFRKWRGRADEIQRRCERASGGRAVWAGWQTAGRQDIETCAFPRRRHKSA